MANYVYNRLVCTPEILKKYFLDSDPWGDGNFVSPPYITFHKLFGCRGFAEYEKLDMTQSTTDWASFGSRWRTAERK